MFKYKKIDLKGTRIYMLQFTRIRACYGTTRTTLIRMRRFLKRYYLPRLRAKNVNKLPRRERAGAIVIHGFSNETIQKHCSACQILLSVRGTKSKVRFATRKCSFLCKMNR